MSSAGEAVDERRQLRRARPRSTLSAGQRRGRARGVAVGARPPVPSTAISRRGPRAAGAATATPARPRRGASRRAARARFPPAPRRRARAIASQSHRCDAGRADTNERQLAVVERLEDAVALADVEIGLAAGTRADAGAQQPRARAPRAEPTLRPAVPCGSIAIVTRGWPPALGPGGSRERRRRRHDASSGERCENRARMADRTYAKFTFFKLDPAWQRRDARGAGAG